MRLFTLSCVILALALPAAAVQPSFEPPELFKSLGPGNSGPRDFRRLGDLAVFQAGTDGGRNLWRTDGTPLGTYPVLRNASIDYFFGPDDGHQVYFLLAQDLWELWRSDGTEAGTMSLTPGGLRFTQKLDRPGAGFPTQVLVPETGLLFFSAGADGASPIDYELWATDGTPGGTRLVKNVNPQGASFPSVMTTLGGKAFFVAQTAEGTELWGSDGTAAGTMRVKDLGPGDDRIVYVRRVGDTLVVVAYSGANTEVWRSDGTAAGTALVKEIASGGATGFRIAGRNLFFGVFRAIDQPTELWRTDGTEAGTLPMLQGISLEGGFNSQWELYMYPAGDGLFFHLWDPEHGAEPWVSDGTPPGTGMVADICPGPCSSSPGFSGKYGARALFDATDGVSGTEPWASEFKPSGRAWRLGDLCPGECRSFLKLRSTVAGWFVFSAVGAVGPDGEDLWVSEGSPDSAVRVSDFEPESWFPGFFSQSTVFGNRLIFSFQPAGQEAVLWSLTLPPFDGPPDPPPGEWISSPSRPGFGVKARITSGADVRSVQQEPCIGETICLSGAVPGRAELFVRVIGPRPNGYLWPTLVRFTTSQAEVWIEQNKTGIVRYYRLEAVPRDSDELNGLVDRTGFRP
jgi:ELWxxDGT repeat protein